MDELRKKQIIDNFKIKVIDELKMCEENPYIYPFLCRIKQEEEGMDRIIDWAMNIAIVEGKKGNFMTVGSIIAHIESSFSE